MKHIVITGSSGGLGTSLAESYLRTGDIVFGLDKRTTAGSRKLLELYPETFLYYHTDVRDSFSVQRTCESICRQTDHIDIIMNNAGVLPKNSERLLEDFDIDASLDVFSVNSLGPLRVVQQLMPLIQKGSDKIIINVSSEAGSMSTHCDYICRFDYCMSKAALNIQTIILQRYLRDQGIQVFAVHPGWMKTEMGGSEAPILPSQSASGIVKFVEESKHKTMPGIFFNYDGSQRGL